MHIAASKPLALTREEVAPEIVQKERDIAAAFGLGVRLFAVDCLPEVEKISRAAPGARVFCRILCDGAGADWPLSRKFGCTPAHAPEVLEAAHRAGLTAAGISFHVGSQQRNTEAWDAAVATASEKMPCGSWNTPKAL